jgi:hypothetical protein
MPNRSLQVSRDRLAFKIKDEFRLKAARAAT